MPPRKKKSINITINPNWKYMAITSFFAVILAVVLIGGSIKWNWKTKDYQHQIIIENTGN